MMRYLAVLVVVAVATGWGGDMRKAGLAISGMHCEHCTDRVKSALTKVQDVQSVQVDLKKGTAEIELPSNSSTTMHMLASAVADAGYGVSYKDGDETKNVAAAKAHMEDEECIQKGGSTMDCSKEGKMDCCNGKSVKTKMMKKK